MDKIDKNLFKIPAKQRKQVIRAVELIAADRFTGLDVKKLKNTKNVFRVRVGKYRIIFTRVEHGQSIINVISKRDDKTYKDFR